MTQTYFDLDRADEPYSLPDCEIFYMSDSDAQFMLSECELLDSDDDRDLSGWYWWACFPGCLPDGDPSGPFDSYLEALIDARSANDLYNGYSTPQMTVWYLWHDTGHTLQISDTIPQNAPKMISYLVTYLDVIESQIREYVDGKALRWFYNAM